MPPAVEHLGVELVATDDLVEQTIKVAAGILVKFECLGETVAVAGKVLGTRQAFANEAVHTEEKELLDLLETLALVDTLGKLGGCQAAIFSLDASELVVE